MRSAIVASLILLTACAASRSETTPPTRSETIRIVGGSGTVAQMSTVNARAASVMTIPSSLDDVWKVLPAVYESLGIPITRVDATSHIIGNEGLKVRRRLGDAPLTRYLDCGSGQGGPNADTYEVHLAVLTEAREAAPGSTHVSTTIQATARPLTFSADPVRCASNGALETLIVKRIKEGLQQ
jgi:hypothetical protein